MAQLPLFTLPPAQQRLQGINALASICTKCPLALNREKTCLGNGLIVKPYILFIGDIPTSLDSKTGLAMQGSSRDIIQDCLHELHTSADQCFYLNTVLCPTKGFMPQLDQTIKCSNHIQGYIHLIMPQSVAILGEHAKLLLSADTMALIQELVIPSRIITTIHPRRIYTENNLDIKNKLKDQLINDLKKITKEIK